LGRGPGAGVERETGVRRAALPAQTVRSRFHLPHLVRGAILFHRGYGAAYAMRIAYLDRDGRGLAERGNRGGHRQYWSGRHNHQCHKRHDDQQADDKQECTHDGNFRIARWGPGIGQGNAVE
jgi:hypothetical protein